MGATPFATIIVPTYNQEDFLPQALDSLLSQTDGDWEAIVVNDGSTDCTAEIAEEYARRDGRIRCIHKKNGGVASALNTGLAHVRGEWIHWLSSDDLFEPQKLATNRRWIKSHPECKFFFSYFTLLTQVTGRRDRRELWGPLPAPEFQILTLFYRNYINGISICIQRSFWDDVGYFDESLYYAQDYGQWLRLLQRTKAVFIPEWLVVSRNHSAQGSETFPDACYFDTAKAAIQFINRHTFQEIVPWAGLGDSHLARQAVSYALDVACDRTAFIYCLGPNTALVMRVLEWVFSDCCPHPELQIDVVARICQMSFVEGDDDWVWMWRQLAVAVQGSQKSIIYQPIDHIQIAQQEYQARLCLRNPNREPLRRYLERFEGVCISSEFDSNFDNPRMVFLLDRAIEHDEVLTAIDELARSGCRCVVLDLVADASISSWRMFGWVPIIRVAAFDRETLPWLGEIDLAITFSEEPCPVWVGSLFHLGLARGAPRESIKKSVLDILGTEIQWAARPVAFLERVLWGGGAERVVFDVSRHLDRRRYRPYIFTMFEEHATAPSLPRSIVVANLRQENYQRNNLMPHGSVMAGRENIIRRFVRRLHIAYHQTVGAKTRAKLGIGRRLAAAKARVFEHRLARKRKSVEDSRILINVAEGGRVDSPSGLDFVASINHHSEHANSVAAAMRELGEGGVLISIMEEAAVAAWLAQAELRFPYVVSLHSLESQCLRDIYNGSARFKAEKWLLAASCKDAESVTLPSTGCCNDIIENFSVPRTKVLKLWNPVDCSRVRRLSFEWNSEVEQWRMENSTFRLVHVGRLDPQKNHDLLLSVCGELKKRQRQFSLAIVGEGLLRSTIEKKICDLGLEKQVRLVGEQKNPFPWMAAADTLLLTSRFESFALVLVEAMVCGTPVVSVNCPTGPEEVLENGRFGLLAANNDPISVADAVECLMDNPSLRRRFAELGYERAQSFDVKNIVPQWEALIDIMSATKNTVSC